MERNGESWGREIRTFGAGVKLLHDKIKTRTSCGVRVGRTVEAVPVEAVVVGAGRGAGAAAAVASAAVGVLFMFFAIFKICWSSKIFLEVVRVLGLVEVVLVEGRISRKWSWE